MREVLPVQGVDRRTKICSSRIFRLKEQFAVSDPHPAAALECHLLLCGTKDYCKGGVFYGKKSADQVCTVPA